MKLPDRAKELDARYVPVAAAKARSGADLVAARLISISETRSRIAQTKAAELDQRYGGSRLLTTVRDIPQLGFVVIAAVFLAGTAAALLGHQPAPPSASPGPIADQVTDAGNRLGPDVGQTTSGYEASTLQDLEHLADTSPTSTRTALVTLKGYLAPAQVEALLAHYQVRRVYLRAAAGGPDAAEVPYDIRGELGSSLRKAYADVALSRLAVRRSYLAYVETTTDDKAYHDDYAAYAASTGREVIAYQHSCACVFSALVDAPARDLVALRAHPEVRAIQVAGEGLTLAALIVQPLLPETTGLVTKGPVSPAP